MSDSCTSASMAMGMGQGMKREHRPGAALPFTEPSPEVPHLLLGHREGLLGRTAGVLAPCKGAPLLLPCCGARAWRTEGSQELGVGPAALLPHCQLSEHQHVAQCGG